jgi:two-component sensor histidine kinase
MGDSSYNRVNWWPRIVPGSIAAYVLAIVLVIIAVALRGGLGFITRDLQAFTTVYPAIIVATLLGGAGPGVIGALLGGFICSWEFLNPYTALLPMSSADQVNVLIYAASSVIIVLAAEHYRKLTKRLRDEEKFRKLAVDELAHRLKNKVATIQSIINFRLREHPEAKAEIDGSLTALLAVDDLITETQGQGAQIEKLLSAELKPYDISRISMAGPQCLLSPKLALTMALLIHELTTNAAKYGALSCPSGKLSIDWSVSGGRLILAWVERGGPPVSPPKDRGFGTRLVLRALEQFDGKVHADFAPSGLVCKLEVVLPQLPEHAQSIFRNVSDKCAKA